MSKRISTHGVHINAHKPLTKELGKALGEMVDGVHKHTPFRGYDSACHVCGNCWDGGGVCPVHIAGRELLAACKAAHAAILRGLGHAEAARACEAAIIKATGEKIVKAV